MADEKLLKKMQDLRFDDPTLKAIEKMAQATHPLTETMRAMERHQAWFRSDTLELPAGGSAGCAGESRDTGVKKSKLTRSRLFGNCLKTALWEIDA
ncbi:MAG: hypothetical protein HYZ57_04060 [Acidobacteria bacterium]|nr:hypothetical protein [Acidobacteriota bacterium]MBI3279000.1 hypothetical protein [Acidobacteriota bacterium]